MSTRTLDDLRVALVKAAVQMTEGSDEAELAAEEAALGITIPDWYRSFLRACRQCKVGGLTILGAGRNTGGLMGGSIRLARQAMDILSPDHRVPNSLIPVATIGAELCACIDTSSDDGSIVLWSLLAPLDEQDLQPVADNIFGFLCGRIPEEAHRSTSLDRFVDEGKRFNADYTNVGRLPRDDVWRPYRLCSQDVVLGLLLLKHSIDLNCLLVDVCLIFDPPQFEPMSGTKMAVISLLSEAYRCGSSMEIRFTSNVEGGRVPRAIAELAARQHIELHAADEGRILPSQARQLFLAVSEFPADLLEAIESLSIQNALSIERACYVVHHGVWTRSELECIIRGSTCPDAILAGDAVETNRHAFLQRVTHGRAAVLGGRLDRKLSKRERNRVDGAVELEDDVRIIDIDFDPITFAKTYVCGESMPIPWTVPAGSESSLEPGQALSVLIRPRGLADLVRHLEADIKMAAGGQVAGSVRAVAVARDFENLPAEEREGLEAHARESGVLLLACPVTTFSLDTDVRRRLHSSKLVRQ